MDLGDVKNYLKVDHNEDDDLIKRCTTAAIAYLKNATGVIYHDNEAGSLEEILVLQLIADMYEKREPSVPKDAGYIYQSIILQISLNNEEEAQ